MKSERARNRETGGKFYDLADNRDFCKFKQQERNVADDLSACAGFQERTVRKVHKYGKEYCCRAVRVQ